MLWSTVLIWFRHAWCYHGLSPLKFRNAQEELKQFPGDGVCHCYCRTAAGTDMPYQHSAALSETPLGALVFPRAPLEAAGCHSCVTMMSSRHFPPFPRQGHREGLAVSWSGFLEAFPLIGMRCFIWKMGFRHWGSGGWSGGGTAWGWDLPEPSRCLLSSKPAAPTSF